MSLTLIDATNDSITISWPGPLDGTTKYVLQYRRADQDESAFQTLSDGLTTTQARKKHLKDDNKVGYIFRAKSASSKDDDASWVTHSEPFHLLSDEDELKRLPSPVVTLGGSNQALQVQWSAAANLTAYELQMRENVGGEPWKTIAASVSGTEVRKKNLTSTQGYQFRVRPIALNGVEFPFSLPSEPVVALGLSQGLKNLFNSLEKGSLLRGETHVSLADALGGKEFVLLYASAHWCGPCRQATPMLVNWYNSLGASKTIEVVFLSADHNESSFRDYYKSMPWLAVEFEDDTREQLMGFLQVKGIPQLAVLDGRTGRMLETNAIGKPFDVNRWRSLAANAK
ncbi:hypothetical protein MPSEU_000253800 [Mayamaea pseudoterrestris]|nr:hypothetical protein MPSEU_000253800 [Mayamaea pseudoterrestris]